MEIWIPITIFAAFFQNIRSAIQKHLTGKLSTVGATQVRFLYAIPFALAYIVILINGFGYQLPQFNSTFLIYASMGGLSQIIATALLVAIFSHRNFVVGTTYSKTETIQTAFLGLILLSDKISVGAVIGIILGFTGVIIISSTKNKFSGLEILKSLTSKPALIGILSGLFFGITSVSYRAASLSLEGGFIIQAAFTLIVVLLFQTVVTSIYLFIREPRQMTEVCRNWRAAWLVGFSGMLASAGWFSAMTLENAAHVRALGQIELIFTFLASALFFKEKTTKIELLGMAIIILGILILLLFK